MITNPSSKQNQATTQPSPSQMPSNPWALIPLLLFLAIFVGSGLYYASQGVANAFYQVSATVAILPAIAIALCFGRGTTSSRFTNLIDGIRDPNIITMCLIYLLAGAFESVTKNIGSVTSTVNFGLSMIPPHLMLPGLFLIAALLATAMGTSMGVIATMGPIALGVADQASLSKVWAIGAVVSGSMFGDNLSLISDTTIASVKTQGAKFKEKFILNAYFAIPAMMITMVVLFMVAPTPGQDLNPSYDMVKIIPYALILALALMGINVLTVLAIGILSGYAIGVFTLDSYALPTFAGHITQGFTSMQEIFILSLLIGGLSHIMNKQGGLEFLIHGVESLALRLRNKATSTRIGEMSISVIGSLADFCTANNTVAIILSGDIAKRLAKKHKISPERSACLLDIFTCVFQGLLPYSAQILLASSLSGVSPLEIITHVVYCPILGLLAIMAIIMKWPK